MQIAVKHGIPSSLLSVIQFGTPKDCNDAKAMPVMEPKPNIFVLIFNMDDKNVRTIISQLRLAISCKNKSKCVNGSIKSIDGNLVGLICLLYWNTYWIRRRKRTT